MFSKGGFGKRAPDMVEEDITALLHRTVNRVGMLDHPAKTNAGTFSIDPSGKPSFLAHQRIGVIPVDNVTDSVGGTRRYLLERNQS